MRIVGILEAKTHLSRLIEDVLAGEEILIVRRGRPVARLVPVEANTARRPLGFVPGNVPDAFFAPLPEEELQAWEG